MTERRAFFRVATAAQLAVQLVPDGGEEAARRRVRARHVPPVLQAGALEETRAGAETRALIEILQRICVTLERLDQRLARTAAGAPRAAPATEMEISLSASGIAAPVELEAPSGALVELLLEVPDRSLPLIPALARTVRTFEERGQTMTAFHFEDLAPDDRERIVQLTLREQAAALRARRSGATA